MQYGLKVENYKRVNDKKRVLVNEKENILSYLTILLASILISRVTLLLNRGDINGMAPFGIAFLISIGTLKDIKKYLIASVGVAIGYMTILNIAGERYINLVVSAVVLFVYITSYILEKRIKDTEFLIAAFIGFVFCGLFINKYTLGVNITLALINTIVVVPISFVLRYGIKCLDEFKDNYLFTIEEVISAGILICLIISGIGNLSILNIELRNIISYLLILIIAYAAGGTYGAAIGVTMGIIVGLSSGDMMLGVAMYSSIGLIAGVFKDTGRVFSFLAYFIMYIALALYSDNLYIASVVEVIISGMIYIAIPKKVYYKIELELNCDRKTDSINNISLDEIREEMFNKVKQVKIVLNSVSDALKVPRGNTNLVFNKKGTELTENLVGRVCGDCVRRQICWNREFTSTFNSFQTLLENCEGKKMSFPLELEKKCKKKFELIKGAEKIIDNSKGEEALKGKLEEGRMMIASHIDNMSKSVDKVLLDLNKEVEVDYEIKKLIKKAFSKVSIEYKKVYCYRDVDGRSKIKITMNNCCGSKYCYKKILPIINNVMRKPMTISGEGCCINPKDNECNIIFEEMPKFFVRSYGAVKSKDGEEYSGDSYSFGKSVGGSYVTILSDGMGSGPDAGRESNATVSLVEQFLEAGLSKETAVDMINSIVALKFDEDEKFSTLDLNVVDLYSGKVDFIKIGAVASFIKRSNSVEVIESNMPPFGLLDSMDLDEVKTNVSNGDLIITLSDGVLDIDKKNVGVYSWMKEFLEGASKDPKQLAEDIINKSKELSGDICNDDMTVVVSKVYSMY